MLTAPNIPHNTDEPQPAHQFDDVVQQRGAEVLGMWLFLVTEVMFFGGMFTAYVVYRWESPAAFAAGSRLLDEVQGTINTGVLLTSSLTMALAVMAAHQRNPKRLAWLLGLTMALGTVFLAIKFNEYHHKYVEHHVPIRGMFHWDGPDADRVQLFYGLYFAMTGVHAAHMIIGIGLMSILLALVLRGRLKPGSNAVEILGLYWHFVDIVWIFLFPLLYLIDRHV